MNTLRALAHGPFAVRPFAGVRAQSSSVALGRSEAAQNDLYMRALEPKPPAKPVMAPAAAAAAHKVAAVYTKMMWKRDKVLSKDLNRKLLLKWAAVWALPTDELRREALVVDPFVPGLRVPRQTPPLAGFSAEVVTKVATEAVARKRGRGSTTRGGKAAPALDLTDGELTARVASRGKGGSESSGAGGH
jgi:hypothetical protein